MPWGAAVGAVVGSVANKALAGKDKNGGAGASSSSKDPWSAAAPWMQQNLANGQALQEAYSAQPQSAMQTAAYNNSYGLSDYARSLVPSLLNQMSAQPLGYDPTNPSARPQAFDFNGGLLSSMQTPVSGLQTSVIDPNAVANRARDITYANYVVPAYAQAGWDPMTSVFAPSKDQA